MPVDDEAGALFGEPQRVAEFCQAVGFAAHEHTGGRGIEAEQFVGVGHDLTLQQAGVYLGVHPREQREHASDAVGDLAGLPRAQRQIFPGALKAREMLAGVSFHQGEHAQHGAQHARPLAGLARFGHTGRPGRAPRRLGELDAQPIDGGEEGARLAHAAAQARPPDTPDGADQRANRIADE